MIARLAGAATLFLVAVPASAQEYCDDWNTHHFFTNATAESVAACLEAGADVNARSDSDTAMITALAGAGADLDAPNERGETPLHLANMSYNALVVDRLLELGADPELLDDRGRPGALLVTEVCRWPDLGFFMDATPEQVGSCIKAGANVNARDEWGDTPLHYLVKAGRRSVAQTITLLVNAGAEVNASGKRGKTALDIALLRSDQPLAERLVELGAAPGPAPFHRLFNRADPASCSRWDDAPFFETADATLVARCLETEVEVSATDRDGYTPLHLAARRNGSEVVTALLRAGAEVNGRATGWSVDFGWDYTPLHEAARENEDAAVAGVLLRFGADVHARGTHGSTPLHLAAKANPNPEVIVALLDGGGDVGARREGGRTPLHEAAQRNNPAVLAALLDTGAEVDVWGTDLSNSGALPVEWEQRTPLHAAAQWNGDPEIIELLVRAGADVHARTEAGHSPLDLATAHQYNPDVVEALIDLGADVNAPGRLGQTPLHRAAQSNPAVFPSLLEAGADPAALDELGRTPLDYARENGALQGLEVVRRLNEAARSRRGCR